MKTMYAIIVVYENRLPFVYSSLFSHIKEAKENKEFIAGLHAKRSENDYVLPGKLEIIQVMIDVNKVVKM